jgi:hypothetical protein
MSDQTPRVPDHLAAMANENDDAQFTCPRCDWFAQAPVDAAGVFLHQLSDARMGHAAIAHPELWEMWRELPADAVKLGDATVAEVREVEAERNAQELRAITAEAKLNEIREVLAVQRDGSIDDANFSIVESIRAILDRPAAAPAEPREEHRLTHSWGRQGLTISLSCTCGSWHRSDRTLSHGDLGEALKDWTTHAHGSVVEHQPDPCKSCVAAGVCERPTAKDCIAVTRESVVEHQPAQDSEGDR